MTTWAISFVETFLNELLSLPDDVSRRVTKKVKILEQDPISAQGDAKKLRGYTNIYRVRVSDYRLFYSIGQGWVKLLSIRKRDERTYEPKLPKFETPAPPEACLLEPQIVPAVIREFGVESRKVASPTTQTETTTTLPLELTELLLKQWQIPQEYWSDLLGIKNCEALLDLHIPVMP